MRIRKTIAVLLAAVLFAGSSFPSFAAQTETSAAEETEAPVPDIDLTPLSTTMVIAEVTNMMNKPEDYVGKRIRTVGILQVFEYNGRNIFSTYLGDAAGCCGNTLEFNRAGDYRYPEDYPAPGSVVFVEGVYELYEEDGQTYCWLNDAVMSTEKFWEKK